MIRKEIFSMYIYRFAILLWMVVLCTFSAIGQNVGGKAFLRWVPSQKSVYQGEAFVVKLQLYYEGNVSSPEIFPKLSVANSWVKEIKQSQKPVPFQEQINGKTYGVVVLKKYLVIPQKSGTLTLPAYPITIKVTVAPKPDDFFQVEQTVDQPLTASELSFSVKSLPEPKPATFSGAVGKFSWKVISDKDSLIIQNPVLITYQIAGVGNIPFVSLPLYTLPTGLEGFEIKSTDEQFLTEKGLSGGKIFTQTMVGEQAGVYPLSLGFTYFDPSQEKYISLTDSLLITVRDTTQKARSQTSTELPERKISDKGLPWDTQQPNLSHTLPFWRSDLYWLLCVLPFGVVILVWGYSQWDAYQKRSIHYPLQKAVKALQHLKKKGNSLSTETAKEIETILFSYFSGRYQLEVVDWYLEYINRLLEQHKVSKTVREELSFVLKKCTELRFAKSVTGQVVGSSEITVTQIIQILKLIEKQSKPDNRKELAIGFVLMLWVIGSSLLAAIPESQYRQAETYYQKQQFDSTITILNHIVKQGNKDKVVYSNLANCYVQTGKTGLAIANYEKAKGIEPMYSAAIHNLDQLRKKKNLIPPVESPWQQAVVLVNLNLMAGVSLGLIWLGAGIILLYILSNIRRQWRIIGYVCVILGILSVVFLRQVEVSRLRKDMYIVIASTKGYYAPNIKARELVQLPEGAAVSREDLFSGWAKVRIPDGRKVWVNQQYITGVTPY
ncbi:BatD family protein [Cytophagaceae bacterium YF14B1]|uniref:BatD family protein n=1 Tax=Xanthocytophaga flava TaxID=3048013 RepID=A0AAE3QRQ7_9BACT|nr:BatD family protein [Xanthocytophaga flavus]MDJ1481976.1 BatD family protein [Xanthocytophaga flavus]